MSYKTIEESPESGSPITLYEFRVGPRAVDVLRFTDADSDIPYGGQDYVRETISRSDIEMDGNLKKQKITISLPSSNEIPKLFVFYPPSFVVTVRILEGHFNDDKREYLPIMTCRVLSCERTGIEAKLTCEPSSTSLKRIGLRRNYQRQCPLVLYGGLCRAVRRVMRCSVVSVNGNIMRVAPSQSVPIPRAYGSGIAEWVHGETGRTELRTILSCAPVGANLDLRLSGPINGDPASVSIVKGCTHTETACRDWHNNIVNFGGQPWIPLKNPIGNISEFF